MLKCDLHEFNVSDVRAVNIIISVVIINIIIIKIVLSYICVIFYIPTYNT
jgi:hypothetical protein